MFKKINNLFVFIKEKLLKDDLHKLKQSDILFFCHDNDRGIDFNKQAYSPILDSYSEELQSRGLSIQTLAHPWSKLGGGAAYGNPLLFNRSYFFAKVIDKIFKTNQLKNLYLKIFKKIKPKEIITIGCNDALCQAARELNILHTEILHGFGYDPIPWGWDNKKKECLPQNIYTFDEVSTNTFQKLSRKDIKITQIQHPFLRRFEKSNISELPLEWAVNSRNDFEKQILISLQWGYATGIDCYPEFEGTLENGLFPNELISVISKTEKQILWRFRFHPVHYRNKEKYRRHFILIEELISKYNNCEWEESTYRPLPSILACCDGHLTMSSMSSYEAAYMDVKTIAFCSSLRGEGVYKNMYKDLERNEKLLKVDFSFHSLNDFLCLNIR